MVDFKVSFKLTKKNAAHPFFGSGPARLLRGIEETKSIAKAAKRMNMAYTKALIIIKRAEEAIGHALVQKQTGGAGGGGSTLTDTAKAWLSAYDECESAINEKTKALFETYFRPLL